MRNIHNNFHSGASLNSSDRLSGSKASSILNVNTKGNMPHIKSLHKNFMDNKIFDKSDKEDRIDQSDRSDRSRSMKKLEISKIVN